MLGFEVLKGLFNDDLDFGNVWKDFSKGYVNHLLKREGFLLKNNMLCIP